MKYFTIIAVLFFQVVNGHGQIKISGKVFPGLALDHVDSLKVVLKTSTDVILETTLHVDKFKLINGEYARKIFELKLEESTRYVQFEASYKYKESRGTPTRFSYSEVIKIPINNREKRIELEIYFHTLYHEEFNVSSKERISKILAKKIYQLPEEIKLIRDWNPGLSTHPKYIIKNDSGYKLYGAAGDGKFEGELFRIEGDSIRQVYTGGYDLAKEPSKQLFKNNHVVSTIRDFREPDSQFICKDRGKFLYRVYLGFYPYKQSLRYGEVPFYSVNKNDCWDQTEKKVIQEFFELRDEFEIE